MDLTWIEDFLALAATHNFSKAAALRHVTQPAFSRRIRRLELWAGVDLLDRQARPVKLTPEGVKFRAVAAQSLAAIQLMRDEFHRERADQPPVIRFAAPHTLALALYPSWIKACEDKVGSIRSSLVAANVDECRLALTNGECDFLLSYVDPDTQQSQAMTAFRSLPIGHDQLVPITGVREAHALHSLDHAETIAYLRYAPESLLGRLTQKAIDQHPSPAMLDIRYENAMGEALKVMALQGAGVAWLPLASVRDELAAGTLARAGGDAWVLDMQIRIYRNSAPLSKAAERLWRSLEVR